MTDRSGSLTRHRVARVVVATGCVVGSVLLISCSSNSGSGGGSTGASSTASAGVAQAEKLLAAQQLPPTAQLVLSPVTGAAALRGKTIAYISSGLSFPFSQEVLSGTKAAAAVLGMKVTVTDTQGDPSAASSQIDQAVGLHSSAIILQGTDPTDVRAAIEDAKAAGIPVVSVAALPEATVPATLASFGVSASVTFSSAEAGKQLADFVVANSNGNADVGIIGSSTFPISAPTIAAFKSELERLCPSCSTVEQDSPETQWATTLQSQAASMVISHPDVNYLFPLVDAMAATVKAGIASSGASSRVKVVSLNASIGDLKAIASGTDPEVADVGGPNVRMGWASVDQVVRLLTGAAANGATIPQMTFDAASVSKLDLSKPRETFFGTYDYVAAYEKSWGMS